MKIHWSPNSERRFPFGEVSPDPERIEPIGFPPPWPDRPWIYGVMVASKDGIVAWKPEKGKPHPVGVILGNSPDGLADKLHVLHLYTYGDVSVGAQTVRDQPELILAISEPGKEVPEFAQTYRLLEEARIRRRLPLHPLNIVYSRRGDPELLGHVMFNTPGITPIIITTEVGAERLRREGAARTVIAAGREDTDFVAAHTRLFHEYGTRYLDCMGGETILQGLRDAGILDEVFVTISNVEVNIGDLPGRKEIMDFTGAELIAEGHTATRDYTFQRWRFNQR